MIVSWNWLKEYVDLTMAHDDLVSRLTMSGLNHESTEDVDGDRAIDLEVTSNRADCLGHIGIAREIAALFELDLKLPDPQLKPGSKQISDFCQVSIECPDSCFRYTARLIQGARIGPSPVWLQKRLTTLGIGIVNNVVDVTNYVMFECGQPLHAFDFAKVKDGTIIVRNAKPGESLVAIDHREYELTPQMCVIADSKTPSAVGGVMGGAQSEISASTTEILIEAAYFDQLSIRNTARKLNLHSPSSFRFERDINSANIEWASRRCCELILLTAGGELVDGFIDVGMQPTQPDPIELRHSQLKRLLGIEIPVDAVPRILASLGLETESKNSGSTIAVPPSWRKDLTREVDLVEEVGRIYGYDKVPDNARVPMAASHRLQSDRVLDKARTVLTAAGFDEAVTPSLVPQPWSDAFSPWTGMPALQSSQPMLGVLEKASQNIGAVDLLRRSLVPSLLEAHRINEYRSNEEIELFETAKVYLARPEGGIPDQPTKLALVSQRDYPVVKGVVESLVRFIVPQENLSVRDWKNNLFDVNHSVELKLDSDPTNTFGFLGSVSKQGQKLFGLRTSVTVCELDLGMLQRHAVLVAQHQNLSMFPPVSRDFNFIVENAVHWADLAATVKTAAGTLLEDICYRETFRDEKKDGPTKKRLLLTVVLRSDEATLTGQQADDVCQRIIKSCETNHSAALVG